MLRLAVSATAELYTQPTLVDGNGGRQRSFQIPLIPIKSICYIMVREPTYITYYNIAYAERKFISEGKWLVIVFIERRKSATY